MIHTHNDATQDSESTAETMTNQPTDTNAGQSATGQSATDQSARQASTSAKPKSEKPMSKEPTVEEPVHEESKREEPDHERSASKAAPPTGTVFRPDGTVDFSNASPDTHASSQSAQTASAPADSPQSHGDAAQPDTADTESAETPLHRMQLGLQGFAARFSTAWGVFRGGVSTVFTAVASFLAPMFSTIARGWHAFASTISRGWHAFVALKAVQAVWSALRFFKTRIWDKRMRFSFAFYTIVFIVVTAASVIGLQWSVYTEPTYAKGQVVDDQTKALNSVAGQLTSFVSQIWLHQSYQAWLNFIVLGVLYLTVILVINRFWVATAVFGALMTVFAIADKIKVELRNEPIIPADLQFITGGNGDSIMSFTTKKDMMLINSAVTGVIWLIVVCVVLQFLDRRRGLIPYTWKRSAFVSVKNITAMVCRWATAILSVVLCASFTWGCLSRGPGRRISQVVCRTPRNYGTQWAMRRRTAPTMNFLRLARVKIMDKPSGYSKESMEALAKKYAGEAGTINQTRTANLTDSTVIMVLSESFSDPTRVPGVSFTEDPMPQIRAIKSATTSGLMLSPGYGGGTANIEYQALTGLNMANYDSSLSIAYQQLVPKLKWTPTFNQIWNQANGKSSSIAFHDFSSIMYFRDRNYQKFGFSKFYSTDGKLVLQDLQSIDSDWYYSDSSFYRQVLESVEDNQQTSQFIQIVTMQNHLPYNDWYENNQFKDEDTSSDIDNDEKISIETYAKGVNYTDQATADLLNQLNQINRPITVIFYGDHLPGIYSTANEDKHNQITLHETDYFIWSNAASASANTKLDDTTSDYTSSNYFMAQAAQHLNAKVSPYLAFLTEMHAAIPAISVPASAGDASKPVYLDADGNRIQPKDLTTQQKELLHDYQLIQYDLTAGKQYLKDTSFMATAK
ncbi:phosphoglycerol transferase [Bifidobacterium thermacidophilum subsp. thermacidophilum]|uniref:Phosphoglycerol transferase n=1 Tax=Bifidobacterium thermacidophilum subsp. thermacidophilum TaxID=79262 RepID=A0A087E3D6_9BIFI|nr:phosphoglycerol transferase [Bifidobacterium thermacidophilum subsp. thermacidophilum]